MGFRGLLELLGITLGAPPPGATVAPVECDMVLFVGSPELVLDYDDAAWVMIIEDDLPLDVASPALPMAVDDEAMNLVCPY
jgi:hypothetical protein